MDQVAKVKHANPNELIHNMIYISFLFKPTNDLDGSIVFLGNEWLILSSNDILDCLGDRNGFTLFWILFLEFQTVT